MAVARKDSQVIIHVAIGFAIADAVTGSIALGGLTVLIEPVLNVPLVPFTSRPGIASCTALRHSGLS